MAWNEPGGPGDKDKDKDKDPWQRKKDKSPPDLDQIVKNIQNKLVGLFGNKKGGGSEQGGRRGGAGLIVIVVLAVWMLSGFYIVQQGERAVILRFGQQAGVIGPGLHWHLPFPIEKKIVINVEKLISLDLGYRRGEKGQGTSKIAREALILTEDDNIVDMEFTLQYKISNPSDYLFNVSDPEATIAQVAESAVREIIGKNTLDSVIPLGSKQIEQAVQAQVQEVLNQYKAGIQIVTAKIQKAQLPEQIKATLDDMEKARDEAGRLTNEAELYAKDLIPRARAVAARRIQEAQGYKASVIARAEGDAKRFNEIINEYTKAPAVTRERLYIETIERLLSATSKIFVDQKGGTNILNLPLDRLIQLDHTGPSNAAPQAQETPEAPAPSPEPLRERGRERERERSKRGG